MQASPPPDSPVWFRRRAWPGILVGLVTFLVLKSLLPIMAVVWFWKLAPQADAGVHAIPAYTGTAGWMVQEAAVFVASLIAGSLAALAAPLRSIVVPVTLVVFSLLATCFEQIPQPADVSILAIWSVGPCLGLLLGILAVRWWRRPRLTTI